uniref:Uncharacterized protein n=1 Tax=Arundo donax TaxID=35708 RepID=A0A0A9HMV9_ARUDO
MYHSSLGYNQCSSFGRVSVIGFLRY